MPDYVTLMGAEQVRDAGRNISSAAESIRASVGYLAEELRVQREFMERWLETLERVLDGVPHV